MAVSWHISLYAALQLFATAVQVLSAVQVLPYCSDPSLLFKHFYHCSAHPVTLLEAHSGASNSCQSSAPSFPEFSQTHRRVLSPPRRTRLTFANCVASFTSNTSKWDTYLKPYFSAQSQHQKVSSSHSLPMWPIAIRHITV